MTRARLLSYSGSDPRRPLIRQLDIVRTAAEKLSTRQNPVPVLVGFDGFIDSILYAVDERHDSDTFRRIDSMSDFGKRITDAAGKSCNIELVSNMVKLGGNGPILANALANFGYEVTYIGALGVPTIHPVFTDFVSSCKRVISLCDPATTDALEFKDGKVMLGKMSSFTEVNWLNLLKQIPEEELNTLLQDIELVACVNWTMLPYMNGIYKGLGEALIQCGRRLRLFIDLTDPRKRLTQDVLEALELLQTIQPVADVILGLNELESAQIADALGLMTSHDLQYRAEEIRKTLDLDIVVIHPRDCAYAAQGGETYHIHGPFTQNPVMTTGAGDVFNGGFCHGLLAGLSTEEALASGVCASGFYVRNSRSATHEELADFMFDWLSEDCGPI